MSRRKFISSEKLKSNVDFILSVKYKAADKKEVLGDLYTLYLKLSEPFFLDKHVVIDFARQLNVPRSVVRMACSERKFQEIQRRRMLQKYYITYQDSISTNSRSSSSFSSGISARKSNDTKKWNRKESEKLQKEIKELQQRKARSDLGDNEFDRMAMK